MDSIPVNIAYETRRISNNSHNSAVGSASRSRPMSQVSALSSEYTSKWAIYAVGNNMSYEFGLNHNNNISIFEQMNWNIDESQFTNVSDAIEDIHDEEEEKKEIIDDNNVLDNKLITADGIVWNKKIWNHCLQAWTNGPGWHMYLFGGGSLYCAGSNASGCFSLGKEKKGTYIQTLTQHSYFRDNGVNITYLSSGCSGHHSFVIDDNDDIYAIGEGSHYQLALDNEQVAKNKENYWPMKIHFFENMHLKIYIIQSQRCTNVYIFIFNDG